MIGFISWVEQINYRYILHPSGKVDYQPAINHKITKPFIRLNKTFLYLQPYCLKISKKKPISVNRVYLKIKLLTILQNNWKTLEKYSTITYFQRVLN